MRYASDTSVSVERSRAEIETTLRRYGASEFASGWQRGVAIIGFKVDGRFVKFTLPLPDQEDEEFKTTHEGSRRRTPTAAHKAWEQACRQRWRALNLCIMAKLEAVESGITTFEDEFLAHIVIPGGGTVAQWIRPQLEQAYESGKIPKLLPMLEAAS